MKKILRLVTTSVLTLTLVACGEASSSVSSSVVSSTPASSSVLSPVSSFANVTSITISAASNTLKQLVGATQTVSVVAAVNANTNPATVLEWYVNGVKTGQTGRIFEYVPTVVGDFKIQAKVGNTASNELTVSLTAPVFAVTSAAFVGASQIKIVAPAGAKVTLTGATLADTSKYDIAMGAYILDLTAPVVQGGEVAVKLERDGNQALTRVVTFDTRKFEIDTFEYGFTGSEAAVAAVGGVYTIVKPFDDAEEFNKRYEITIKDELVRSTTPIVFKVETTVPTGATAVVPVNSLVVTGDPLTQFVTVTSETVPGLYTHKLTLGPKTFDVKVQVVNPTAKVEFEQLADGDDDFDLLFGAKGVTAGADGVFEITRPFETYGTTLYNLNFKLIASGFTEPEFVTNQAAVAVTGPSKFSTTPGSLFAGVETLNSSNGNLGRLFSFSNFAGSKATTEGAATTSDVRNFIQSVDSGTPLGLYTFSVSFGATGNIVTKEVKVRLVAPTPTLDFVLGTYTSIQSPTVRELEVVEGTNSITIEKPAVAGVNRSLSWLLLLSNYQSAEATQDEIAADSLRASADKQLFAGTGANVTTVLGGGVGDITKFYKFVNYSLTVTGPQAGLIPNQAAGKVGALLAPSTDGLVVRNNTFAPVIESDLRTLIGDTLFELDAVDPVDELALLQVNSTTVPGAYTYTFVVDSLVRTMTINIVNPTQRVFVLNVETNEFATATEKITVKSSGADVLLAPKANGEYDIEAVSTLRGFQATIGVTDLLVSTAGYNYNIVKTYPDGRVETITDVVKVTATNSNLLATLDSTNTKFISNWSISEDPDGAAVPAKGKYTYAFTLNGVTKSVVINVIDGPSLSLGAVKLGTTTLALHNSKYRVTLTDAGSLTVAATPVNLATTRFVAVSAVGTGFTAAATRVAIGTSGSVTLGALVAGDEASEVVITLTYFAADTGGVALGDAQVITVRRNA
jgi:hypothetical protein